MKGLIFLCSLLCVAAIRPMVHNFYVSILQIDYNKAENTLEMSAKFFTDDLALALEKEGYGKLSLNTSQEKKDATAKLGQYLQQQIIIKVNGKPCSWKWIGKEKEDDAIWCYMEIGNLPPTISSIEVTNNALINVFDSQTNMVNLKVNGQKKSLVLKRGKSTGTAEF